MYICAQNMLAYCPRQTKSSVNIHIDTTKKNLQAHVPRMSKHFFPLNKYVKLACIKCD